jgi:hypothetical protein
MAISYFLTALGVFRPGALTDSGWTDWLPNCYWPSPAESHETNNHIFLSLAGIKSKSRYHRRSVGQSVLISSPIWAPRPDFCYCQTFAVLRMWGDLSNERTGLSFVAVIVSGRWHLYLQVYLSKFYVVICHFLIKSDYIWRPLRPGAPLGQETGPNCPAAPSPPDGSAWMQ